MIKKIENGIHAKLSLGEKTIQNIEKIVRKHMNYAGTKEAKMPSVLPINIFELSGRKDTFRPFMFKLKDRYDREYALGPTHEELFAFVSQNIIK